MRPELCISTMPCVATIGVFDGVHTGHRYLIQQVKQVARQHRLASVLVTFTQHPARVLRPDVPMSLLTTSKEKDLLLQQTGVDHIVKLPFTHELSQLSAQEFMRQVLHDRLHVQVLVIGYDHRFGHGRTEGFEDYVRMGKEMGMEVVEASPLQGNLEGTSSSKIRKHLLAGNVEQANALLGYTYSLTGKVIDGFHVGRTIGFPTANLQPDDADKLVPRNGVYAVSVQLENGTDAAGMLNIGFRPTLDNGTERSIEVHLFDFHDNLYAQQLRIQFLHFIRQEQKFESLAALQTQLRNDEQACRSVMQAGS